MKLTLTTMAGNTRNINLSSKEDVYQFIELLKPTLHPNQRVKVTCDLLGIDGYLQGVAQGDLPLCVLTKFFIFIFSYYISYTFKKYSDFLYNEFMAILENFENAWDIDLQEEPVNLSVKIFSETVCNDCSVETESAPIIPTDSMGRKILWEN